MEPKRNELVNDLIIPTILFAALGGMNWAVRGSRGYGGMIGCIFAGVLWGVAWWYCARVPARQQLRRYASGWIVLAMTFGVGLAGARGWMQWPHFFEGRLYTHFGKQEFVPISRNYGFLWLFIAGVPWAGLSACMLAWCGSLRETRVWHWILRIICGIGCGYLFRAVYDHYPQFFLPLYSSLEERYHDAAANPELQRLTNDCGSALLHMGYYVGFLLFEILRRDTKNVVLILTVGIVNGAGWAALQNWKWAANVWKNTDHLFWRCWEASGGISMGIAYGIAFYLVNRKMSEQEREVVSSRRALAGPNFEWLIVFCGLTTLLYVMTGRALGGTIGLYELGATTQIGEYLRTHLDSWSDVYFSSVLLFGLAYYHRYRNVAFSADAMNATTRTVSIEWPAVVLVTAMLLLVWTNQSLVRAVRAVAGSLFSESVANSLVPPRGHAIYMIYVGLASSAGMLWYLSRREKYDAERLKSTPFDGDPNLEKLGVYLGILSSFGVSVFSGLNGWHKLRFGDSDAWASALWHWLGPIEFLILIAILMTVLRKPVPRNIPGDISPHAYGLTWLVLVVQNIMAQFVTGPHDVWMQTAFSFFYILLFTITGLIIFHLHTLQLFAAYLNNSAELTNLTPNTSQT